jgi:glyoxylase-like metal-dependent hydrolase (beta-lactamase superfamily II)
MRHTPAAICIAIAICTLAEASNAQNFDTVQIKTFKMSETIYMLEGSGGNIGVLTGKDGTVMIDDQFAPLSEKIKAAIKQVTDAPVKFVINTHFHGDHVEGNENFSKDGAIIVAQSNSRLRMTKDEFDSTFKQERKAAPYDALPKVTFGDSVTLHMDGETVQVTHVPNAHTDGDAIIYFKESNIIHTGDVFVRYGLPFIDQRHGGSIDGMIAGADVILNLANNDTKIIPGHGEIATKKDVSDYKDKLVTIRKRIADGIKQGKSLSEIIAADPTREYKTGFDKSAFILLAYESLKNK